MSESTADPRRIHPREPGPGPGGRDRSSVPTCSATRSTRGRRMRGVEIAARARRPRPDRRQDAPSRLRRDDGAHRAVETGGVVVAKTGPASPGRCVGALNALEFLEEHRRGRAASVAAVDLGIDPTTTFGEFMLEDHAVAARELERRPHHGVVGCRHGARHARGVHFTNSVPHPGYRGTKKGKRKLGARARSEDRANRRGDVPPPRAAGLLEGAGGVAERRGPARRRARVDGPHMWPR